MTRRRILIAVMLTFATLAGGQSPQCPEDGSGSYFTGKTRTSTAGRQMKEYKCYRYGHLFWVASR